MRVFHPQMNKLLGGPCMAMAMAWPHRKHRSSVRSDGGGGPGKWDLRARAHFCIVGQLNAQQTHAPLRCPFQLSAVPVQCLGCVQLQQGPGSPGKGT